MEKINYNCPACGEAALSAGPRNGTYFLWCDICTWDVRAVQSGEGFILFDVDYTDPWASVTPQMKEVPFD